MSDVPPEIRYEILLRLPAASLIGFRAVCREWRRLIKDPSFLISHSHRQFTSHTLLIASPTKLFLYSLSPDSLTSAAPVKQLLCPAVRPHPFLPYSRPLASCDGMFLFAVDGIWKIWNSFTRRCHQLPGPEPGLEPVGIGFGYDSASGDYKIVRIDHLRPGEADRYRTMVYSLKLGRWRTIGDCPHCCSMANAGVFVNGALHWIGEDQVIVLDLKVEEYGQVPLPPLPERSDIIFLDLSDLSGYLCLSYYNYKWECLDGWVAEDDGKAWKKMFSIRNRKIEVIIWEPRERFTKYVPVAYVKSRSREQVLLQHTSGFVLVDLGNNHVTEVIGGARISSSVISADRFLHTLNF